MSSAALVALRNRIATNSLTASDQGALTTALDFIAPTFEAPDETASVVFSDEENAREWIAALYTIQAGGGADFMSLARVITPNLESSLPVPFEPTAAGKVLVVADITPESTGLLLVSVNLSIIEDAAGTPGIAVIFLDDLTAVTGGTLIAPGLTAEPTSTTPSFSPGGVVIMAVQEATFAAAQPNNAVLTIAAAPVQVTVGHRVGIFVVAVDSSTQNWTALGLSMSVVEQPA